MTRIPTLTRRCLLRSGAALFAGYDLLPIAPLVNAASAAKANPRGSADQCIFVFLGGGISHVDSFDLKEGPWTPEDFGIREAAPGVRMPASLFPKLTKDINRFAIVRSLETWETEHGRATYYLHAAHPPSPARLAEIPAVGAVVAYESAAQRKPGDILPPFVSLNYGPEQTRQGFLDPKFAPLNLVTGGGFDFVVAGEERGRFDRRIAHLSKLESLATPDALSRQIQSNRDGALSMMGAADIRKILEIAGDDRKRYGSSRFGDACILARNVVASQRGTKFVSIKLDGWDFHAGIYNRKEKSNQYTKSLELDAGISTLVADLDSSKLLARTLVVVMGEFGRTTGDLTPSKGRDHHRFAMSGLFAGAGIHGGRAIGTTDAKGDKVVNGGWSRKRPIYPEDVAATIYSALGIDHTRQIANTPSGRFFQYVEPLSGTTVFDPSEIAELYA